MKITFYTTKWGMVHVASESSWRLGVDEAHPHSLGIYIDGKWHTLFRGATPKGKDKAKTTTAESLLKSLEDHIYSSQTHGAITEIIFRIDPGDDTHGYALKTTRRERDHKLSDGDWI